MRWKEGILSGEGGEALAQAAQRSCGCPIPENAQGQVGRGWEQPAQVADVPAHCRGLHWMPFKGPFQPKPFYDSTILGDTQLSPG